MGLLGGGEVVPWVAGHGLMARWLACLHLASHPVVRRPSDDYLSGGGQATQGLLECSRITERVKRRTR